MLRGTGLRAGLRARVPRGRLAALRPQGRHQLTRARRESSRSATGRLLRWIDGFADRHGPYTPAVTPTLVTLDRRRRCDRRDRGAVPAAGRHPRRRPARARRSASGASACCSCGAAGTRSACSPARELERPRSTRPTCRARRRPAAGRSSATRVAAPTRPAPRSPRRPTSPRGSCSPASSMRWSPVAIARPCARCSPIVAWPGSSRSLQPAVAARQGPQAASTRGDARAVPGGA